ncbi:hypothetical protein RHMOL_Rhmol05G0170000 [Rhododendron molle]|uniref:Uncharacterized protein n=1 Tax=Rhododendron molle TaxID=49168 RepID=A0ACC0NRZ4_RHOML|nr:hypothetical protein RHMOL_Rhmol05G0170000 [Rhododendron molle]
MVKTHDASTQDLSKVHAKLSELEAVDMEITRFNTEWNQLKEDIRVNRATSLLLQKRFKNLRTNWPKLMVAWKTFERSPKSWPSNMKT